MTIVGLIFAVVALLALASFYHSKKLGAELMESSSRLVRNETLEQMRNLAESHVNIISERLVNPLYYQDMDEIKKILVETTRQKKVIYAYVYDTHCRVVHDGTDEIPLYGQQIRHSSLCSSVQKNHKEAMLESEDRITVVRSIWIGDKYLGGVIISMSLTDVYTNIEKIHDALTEITNERVKEYTYNIGLITLALVFFGIFLSLAVSRQFVKPIRQMVWYLRRVGNGDYDIQFTCESKDEIGDLFASFEQMTDALKASTVSVAELRREIRQRTRAESERNEMAVQLQRSQKMEAVGRLASGVAHDLNNIMSGIVSYPELLLLDLPEGSKQRKPLETIRKSGFKATAIVQDLLTLARRAVPSTEIVDFREVVEDYLDSPEYRKVMSFHPNIKVQTKFDPTFTTIEGASAQLGTVVMNLVNNAAEAMPGGGSIQLIITNRYIDTPVSGYDKIEEGEYIIFSVLDSGIGIEKEDLEHIFEPFYTKKTMGRSGTGLGMAVVWGTVKDHNGYIDINSDPGIGTRIDLYLPISRKTITKAPHEKSINELKGSGEKILVVDDVAEQREIASGILMRLGYRIETASSGEEATEYLKSHSADLVLLDMIMAPGIDGCETYGKILEIHPEQKALVASGYSESESVDRTLAMGAGCYIQKPYSLEKLALAVRNELKSDSN